ncbi:unnamed protein product [Ectocarpus sp. 4 AP-2014]
MKKAEVRIRSRVVCCSARLVYRLKSGVGERVGKSRYSTRGQQATHPGIRDTKDEIDQSTPVRQPRRYPTSRSGACQPVGPHNHIGTAAATSATTTSNPSICT